MSRPRTVRIDRITVRRGSRPPGISEHEALRDAVAGALTDRLAHTAGSSHQGGASTETVAGQVAEHVTAAVQAKQEPQ